MISPQTFDAFIPSNVPELISRAKFRPRYIPFNKLCALELEKEFKPSYEFAEKVTSKAIFNHCLRCYYFSLLILNSGYPSNTPGVPQITLDELLKRVFLTCILHDVAFTHDRSVRNHPAHGMSFELQGGIMAYEHLHEKYPSLDATQVGDVAQGIMLHTTQFVNGSSSASNILMWLSAFFDLTGYGGLGPNVFESMLHRESVREIETTYPRGSLNKEFTEGAMEMMKEKPNCLFSHAPPSSLKKIKSVTSLTDSHRFLLLEHAAR